MRKSVDSQCQTFQRAIDILSSRWNALILNVPAGRVAAIQRAVGAGQGARRQGALGPAQGAGSTRAAAAASGRRSARSRELRAHPHGPGVRRAGAGHRALGPRAGAGRTTNPAVAGHNIRLEREGCAGWIDSFAAAYLEESRAVSPSDRVRELVEQIEHADQVGLDVFGIGEHHAKSISTRRRP